MSDFVTGSGIAVGIFDPDRVQVALPWVRDLAVFELAEVGCLDAPNVIAAGGHYSKAAELAGACRSYPHSISRGRS